MRTWVSRHRAAIAANLALVLTVGTVVAYAVSADGYQSHRAELNDGGIWVTSNADGFFGRMNKPIGQTDGVMAADVEDNLDIVQQGAGVVAVNLTDNLLSSVDPATVQPLEGEEAAVAPGALVVMAGGTVAVADPDDGRVWAQRFDPDLGRASVVPLAEGSEPRATAGDDAALTVTARGDVLVASGAEDRLLRLPARGTGFAEETSQDLTLDLGPTTQLTAVGERAVLLDPETGDLLVPDGGSAALPPGSVLQQPGPAADSVLVATGSELLEVDLETGDATALAEDLSGRPTAPVRLGACEYAAWSGGRGAVVTVCAPDQPRVSVLSTDATDLVFRVNRGQILLNDRTSGAVWDLDSDAPARIDDWEAFRTDVTKEDDEQEQENHDEGDRQPPKAKPDELGARPGRTTVLHPLDNDTAPSGRILAIRSLGQVSGPGTLSIGPDGQTVQVQLPADATGSTTFDYVVDDGREDVSDQATVTVRARDLPANGQPGVRPGFKPREWVVAAGGTLDVPVLPDWRDPRDGDPLALTSAQAVGGRESGAVARTTGSGRIRFTAPAEGGVVQVEYAVGDGVGEPVTGTMELRVQDPDATESIAAVAEPDIVSGETGKPITIRPLGNDLPGTDPLTPEATIELAGKVASVGGADVRTDLVEGTITFRSRTARTFLLDYDAAYGSAPIAGGRIRVDVRAPSRKPPEPVAMPDQVTLFGQASTMVDVLANDVDPGGGMLVVQRADPLVDNQLDVAVVQGRWVRVSARQGTLGPNPQVVRYVVSNGVTDGVEGEITVSQRPEADDNTPVTQVDRVTVRAGAAVTVPVLDNDFSPSGDQLRLVGHVAGEGSGTLRTADPDGTATRGDTGSAYVSGRLVRYVAPRVVQDDASFQVRYVAVNEAGQTSPGRVEITVVPAERRNQPPEPPQLEGRAIAGDTVKLRLPGVGVDPDGDAVTLLGIASAPELGRVVRYGANSIDYQAYPGSGGTDEFTYLVVDSGGQTAAGTARVAVVPGGLPQPPLAVPDSVSVAPGRTATVDVMANDLVAGGDRVTVELADPDQPGVRLQSETGPLLIEAPAGAGGAARRNVDVVYRLTNGIDSSQATVTLRTVGGFNNPPIVYDAFGAAEDAAAVSVDVLETAYDPDGAAEDLRVAEVFEPPGVPEAMVADGTITITRGDEAMVVPFRVEDGDGGAATASLYVPARGSNLPFVRDDALVRVDPGGSTRVRLADVVADPAGGTVSLARAARVTASPSTGVSVGADGRSSFTVEAPEGYAGPGAVVAEVTTDAPVGSDEQAVTTMVTIPVQVGRTRPVLRCPEQPIEVPQGETVEVAVSSYCHVWTADPEDADALAFEAEWVDAIDGLSAEPDGGVVRVTAGQGAQRNTPAVLAVSADGSSPGRIRFVVTGGPPPSMSPVRVSDMGSGESRVVDLAPYLRAGVGDPVPTVLEAEQITSLDVDIEVLSDSVVRITTGPRVSGSAQFRVLMSDVARADTGPGRQVEGRIALDVLDVPGTPSAPVPGSSVVSRQVSLTWTEPMSNGAPIDYYEVRASGGPTQRCASTGCDVRGLTNGREYTFQVRAHNSVGFSGWSDSSRPVTPDAKPGLVGPIRNTRVADRTLVLAWNPPSGDASVDHYVVAYAGLSRQVSRPEATITGLDNNTKYQFKVYAVNDVGRGPVRTSRALQSQGPVGLPAAPTVDDSPTSASTATLTVSWPAVPPNGPGPVLYRVLRNGSPIAGCETLQQTFCTVPGVTYDGGRNEFKVGSSIGRDLPQYGPVKEWYAVGKPDAWGPWTVAPTGKDAEAWVDLTVPQSRGTESTVAILVNGSVVREFEARGRQGELINVPDNDRSHSVALRLCNEFGRCSQSEPTPVQTYGPLSSANILEVRAEQNGSQVRWVATVDSNGNGVGVHFESAQRNEWVDAFGVDVQTVASAWVDVGWETTERLNVYIADADPQRGTHRATAETTTPVPPPPVITVTKERCSDDPAAGIQACGGQGPTTCVEATCAFVVVTTTDMRGPWVCSVLNPTQGIFRGGYTDTYDDNGTKNTGFFYRAGTAQVQCDERFTSREASAVHEITF
ncbi:Ig-like domain-containing protein [Nocardioides bigeumensis]|uniref:Ig-like domain-containing protein n=1 Tax=Nocardioides bigeumensis TaxID=433657 RepID=A0ABN2YJ97_9ACTN